MSIEIEKSPYLPQIKHKKTNSNETAAGSKKRKRHSLENPNPASSKKKQKSDQQSEVTEERNAAPPTQEPPATSCLYQQTSSLYLPLPPISQRHALRGLCAEHLSPLILTYFPPLRGVILSYSNARLSTGPESNSDSIYAQAMDEYAATLIWLTADFVIFRPQKGDVIEGWVNLQNESNIGLLCMNFFNASIERKRLSKEWKWISPSIAPVRKSKLKPPATDESEDSEENEETRRDDDAPSFEDTQGYFQDGNGKKVGGIIQFRVKNVETSRNMDRDNGFLNIEGTMLSRETEQKEEAESRIETMRRSEEGKAKYHRPRKAMVEGDFDGSMEPSTDVEAVRIVKHRAKY